MLSVVRPLFFLGIPLIVVGVQFLTFGLLAQMLVVARRDRLGAGPEQSRIERAIGAADEPSGEGRVLDT